MKRIYYADILRVLATFAVIILHCVWYYCDMYWKIRIFDWLFANWVDSRLRFAVPVFVMLSWMLLLWSEKWFNLKRRSLRLIIPLITWSIIYILTYKFYNPDLNIFRNIIKIVTWPISEHLWFPYMLMWLYVITPIIKPFLSSQKNIFYVLGLWLIFSLILPIIKTLTGIWFWINIELFVGYIWYYVLWYYIHNYKTIFDKKSVSITLILIWYLTTFFGTYLLSKHNSNLNLWFYWNFSPNVIIISISIFALIKNTVNLISTKSDKIVSKISEISYWIYLSHVLFITMLFKIFSLVNPIADMFVKSIIVIFITLILNYILSKIKYVKYLFLGI